ncbi:MAG: hypothetical protein HYS12_16340 [Planctomycetes bacterium]|nr:hypothetical protein [Planctomycetota bacterium]
MILLYVVLLLALACARFLVARRAGVLERKYSRVARAAQEMAAQPLPREGNSSRSDPYRSAKHQYLLGQLVQKRDRVEGRYAAWQARSERLGRFSTRLRGWEGRWVPYLLGAADAVLLLTLFALFGSGDVSAQLRQVLESVSSRWTG